MMTSPMDGSSTLLLLILDRRRSGWQSMGRQQRLLEAVRKMEWLETCSDPVECGRRAKNTESKGFVMESNKARYRILKKLATSKLEKKA